MFASFYIILLVINLKIYLDIVFLINFFFDFILLFLVSYILKRNKNIFRISLGALFGSLSIFLLFLNISSITLFLFKILISIGMITISFGYKEFNYFKKNFLYLYVISIMLGGMLYFLEITFSYKNKGILFFNNGLEINFIVLIILSPILIYLYLKEEKNYKNTYSLIHKVEIVFDNKKYTYNGYLDTGNKLKDPYKKRPIILIYDKKISFEYEDSILVPYKTLENEGIVKCKKIEAIKIDNKKINTKVLIGISNKKFNIEGVNCILPNIIKEEFS